MPKAQFKPKKFVSYNDFSGGLNVDANDDNFKPNELRLALNVDLSSRGAAMTRGGIAPLNAEPYGQEVRRIFKWKRADGTLWLMCVFYDGINYTLHKLNPANGTAVQISSLESEIVACEMWNDNFFFIDGGEYNYYDGVSEHLVRLIPPGIAPTVAASGSSGSFTGQFKCMATFVNALGMESLKSPITTVNASAAKTFDWSDIPISGDADCVGRNLYRTVANGSVFKLVAILNDNTTTTYTDAVADGSLGEDYDDTNDLAPIKKCTFLKRHPASGRFFAGGNPDDISALYWSEPNEPGNFQSTSKYYPTTSGGKMLDIDMYDKAVVVHYEAGPYVWTGTDPEKDTTWGPIPISQGIGGRALSTLAGDKLAFVNAGGLYEINPMVLTTYNAVYANNDIFVKNVAKDRLTKEFAKVGNFDLARIAYDWVDGKTLIACSSNPNATTNDKVIVYWQKLDAFTIYTGWEVNDWVVLDDGSVLFASDNYIYKTKQTTYSDNGRGIDFQFETAYLGLGAEKIRKVLTKLFIYIQQITGSATMQIKISSEIDSNVLPLVTTYSGGFWTALYKWGKIARWGDPIIRDKERRCRVKGNRFKVAITNSNNGERVTIYGLGFQFRTNRPRGERS